ncbi:tetrathionate reductase family octaheme c-type cytochrome [Thioalkalivibrio sp. XN279]|uniref:tetrathionate reductase family octaheme c-type cytochrome n=1 Tax=Thioalkalivibrio sp. XN279 TaxID=2714953 RepID=UPI00140C15CA|nr:tetrathionate reductase family octaheme c-type cytochrome [Thioalkalivibrio sp. XN279]NHA13724.1 tetrathionate reductase family octaheme c-type cytochrome [Thioalkalivibrio sp. XN279]
MNTSRCGLPARWTGILLAAAILALGGCSGDDGDDGVAGPPGADGSDGINCWDLNENGVADPEEDRNGDGTIDVFDCQTPPPSIADPETLHAAYFADRAYEDGACLACHGKIGDDILTTGHWKWEGVAAGIEGFEAGIHGKTDIINNFCVAVPTNEGRCTQCHIGYDWKDDTYDFGNAKLIDCFACHDQTGTYSKAPPAAGRPPATVDLQAVAQSVGENNGVPTRKACLFCHQNAGGGDNVKHGDLSSDLIATTREYDVHMGVDGGDLNCGACHDVKRDLDGNLLSHGIGGMPYHSVDEGVMRQCDDCHSPSVHVGTSVEAIFNSHERLACQACHIPAISRKLPTKTEWYWADAGQDIDPIPIDADTGKPAYDKMKGSFNWELNVRPTLRFYDGKWIKSLIGENDTVASLPSEDGKVYLGGPAADYTNPDAKIYPFKKLIGNQPADANNGTILVPHLFGTAGGPNPYWGAYDWNLALQDGADRTGQPYTGEFEFVDTVSYWAVNHEVAPAADALGQGGNCGDCHFSDQIDWAGLGWTADPVEGGTRP